MLAALLATCAAPVYAQQGRQLTTSDYAQAERFMSYNVNPLVFHGVEHPQWISDTRFWYRDRGPDGVTYILVDATTGKKRPAFDHAQLAKALTAAGAKGESDPHHLTVTELGSAGTVTIVDASGTTYLAQLKDIDGTSVTGVTAIPGKKPNEVLSPDGTMAAFIRDWNLWVRDTATGKETQLTTDGVTNYGYATDNAGWKRSDNPILAWSPDSMKIATFQQDQRKDGEMYLVPVTNGHPKLEAWKYPLVGDPNVTMIERVIIDVPSRKVIRLKMAPDQHRSTICDDVSCGRDGGWDDVQWSGDSKNLAFVSTSRDHKQEWFRIADAASGEVREVMTESAPKFFESGSDKVNWHYLPESNELLWFSERDNWGQLYLYDLTTGKLKNQITHGDGNVTQVLHVDPATRKVYFLAVGKEAG
ncbi:MAG: DPP IV N-terminal domain-containing protein, partial [Acidobacteriaceae bacterium]|nr:DPP IV N-terminal domain-containing protein [Acidobacteriaceae bacterium]